MYNIYNVHICVCVCVYDYFFQTGASNQIDILKYFENDRTAIVRVHQR